MFLRIGIGFALCFPAFNMQATAGIANEEQGLASGLVNTSFQVGGALGLAIVSAVVTANSGGGPGAGLLDGFRPAIAVVTGVAALGVVVALTDTRLFARAEKVLEPVVLPAEPVAEAAVEREAA